MPVLLSSFAALCKPFLCISTGRCASRSLIANELDWSHVIFNVDEQKAALRLIKSEKNLPDKP